MHAGGLMAGVHWSEGQWLRVPPPDAIERDGDAVRAADEWLARQEQRREERGQRAELVDLAGEAAALRDQLARIGAAIGVAPAQPRAAAARLHVKA